MKIEFFYIRFGLEIEEDGWCHVWRAYIVIPLHPEGDPTTMALQVRIIE